MPSITPTAIVVFEDADGTRTFEAIETVTSTVYGLASVDKSVESTGHRTHAVACNTYVTRNVRKKTEKGRQSFASLEELQRWIKTTTGINTLLIQSGEELMEHANRHNTSHSFRTENNRSTDAQPDATGPTEAEKGAARKRVFAAYKI